MTKSPICEIRLQVRHDSKLLLTHMTERQYKDFRFLWLWEKVIESRFCRGVEQLVARWAHNPKAGGSNPPPATKSKNARRLDA